MGKKTTGWETAYFCVSCNQEMGNYVRMNSFGRCRMCGYKDPSAGTIVETYEKGKRMVFDHWFCWFFATGEWEYKDD